MAISSSSASARAPPPPATDVIAFMTPAEYRKSLVTPARAASPAEPSPADAPTDAARETLVAIGQTPGALVSLKGRRSPPPPATSSSSQRQRGTQSALLPLPGAPLPGAEPRPTSSRRPKRTRPPSRHGPKLLINYRRAARVLPDTLPTVTSGRALPTISVGTLDLEHRCAT